MKPVAASPEEQTDVAELLRLLQKVKSGGHLQIVSADGETISIPESIFWILDRVAHLMSRGEAVSIVPIDQELTVYEASDLLNVSVQYLTRLLEEGQIPFISTDAEYRILIEDVIAYKNRRDQERAESLDELSRLSQLYGGYEELRQV